MATQFIQYPQPSLSEQAVGSPGGALPTLDKVVAGTDGSVVRTLLTDNTGQLKVLTGQLPGSLGQKTMANSTSVAIASDQTAVPISAAALPLPAGAATEATLSAASAKLPAVLGQTTMAASMSIAVASNQSDLPAALKVGGAAVTTSNPVPVGPPLSGALPVSATALPLPSGAATETTLAAISTKTPALGQAAMAASSPVVIASNQSNIPTLIQNQLVKVVFDAIVPTFNSTSDVWVYKTGGIAGSTVATLTVNYVDSTKAVITNIAVA